MGLEVVSYTWFDTDDTLSRLKSFTWVPEVLHEDENDRERITTVTENGQLREANREHVSDMWPSPTHVMYCTLDEAHDYIVETWNMPMSEVSEDVHSYAVPNGTAG